MCINLVYTSNYNVVYSNGLTDFSLLFLLYYTKAEDPQYWCVDDVVFHDRVFFLYDFDNHIHIQVSMLTIILLYVPWSINETAEHYIVKPLTDVSITLSGTILNLYTISPQKFEDLLR